MKTSLVKSTHPALRQVAKTITVFDAKLRLLAIKMYYLMKANSAIGIAAPQVGKSIRLIVVSAQADSFDIPKNVYMVNPTIECKSVETISSVEMCLSLPGQCFKVPRHKLISVRYQDLYGNEKLLVGDGLFSRVVQHEVSHLDGILVSDIGIPA